MKRYILLTQLLIVAFIGRAQDSRKHCVYLNLGLGPTLTHKSNAMMSFNAGLNYVLKGQHFFSVQAQTGLALKALTNPNRVGGFTHSQVLYGMRQHMRKGRFTTPYIGASFSNYTVSTYEYDEVAMEAANLLGSEKKFYKSESFKSPGLTVGVNFMFARKYYGFSFEPYMVISKYTEVGLKLNIVNVGIIK